jgi:hypothetical protein
MFFYVVFVVWRRSAAKSAVKIFRRSALRLNLLLQEIKSMFRRSNVSASCMGGPTTELSSSKKTPQRCVTS